MQYPKITQQGIEETTDIFVQTIKNSKFLELSPYSDKAQAKIREAITIIQEAEPMDEEVVLDENDTWGVIRSLTIGIKQMETLAKSSDSDSAKLNAVKGLFDMNAKKVELLDKVIGMSKVAQIESVCKQYFRECKDKDEAQRFITMLDQIS